MKEGIQIKKRINTIYLIISVLVSLLMVFLDPIANVSSEILAGLLIYFILVGEAITLIFSILFMRKKVERDIGSTIAMVLTLINSTSLV